jgi:RHS repeat-associated protein
VDLTSTTCPVTFSTTVITPTPIYVYDAFGQRVGKNVGNVDSEYVYDQDGKLNSVFGNGTFQRGYVYIGGQPLAEYFENKTYFVHGDHLGSTRLLTRLDQSIREKDDYYPYGELTTTVSTGDILKFTGKERDSESGLDNFGARYNASTMGRFMSPDPLGGSLVDPQTLNKYSYVRNNPINLTDPTGLYICADSTEGHNCTSDQDKAFEASRQRDLQSNNADVVRGASAYGDPNVDNHVNVGFADLEKKGEGGNTTSQLGADDKGNLFAQSNVTINSKISGTQLDSAVGHEGSHVADAQDLVKSITSCPFGKAA